MKSFLLWICLISLILATACATSTEQTTTSAKSGETLEQLNPRPGAVLKYLLLKPESPPTDALILFAGGHGNLNLSGLRNFPSIGWGENNFLVRTRKLFVSQGFVVAVVDFPSDKRTTDGRKAAAYRLSDDHVTDILAVVDRMKKDFRVPVWLVGTSAGTISTASLGSRMKNTISGLVLTSSLTNATSLKNAKLPRVILSLPLNEITVPVLVVSHAKDGCKYSPPADAGEIKAALTGSQAAEVTIISGGKMAISDPCEALSPHGFYGKEEETITAIANFIRMN